VSILSTEFRDETLEITDDCKKNRDILNGVLGERSILNTCFGIWVFSRHYILFRGHYKKIFRFGLNSYHGLSMRLCIIGVFNSSDLPMNDRGSSGQVSFNPDGSFTVIRTESDERGATAAEPTQTLPPAPGGDPLMELRGAHPNIERNAEIMEYIRTCGLSSWCERPYNTTCRYVYLVPGTSCSQTLVYLNRDVNEREDHNSIVWVGLVDRGEELPVEASDPLASLSVRYPQVMENPAVDAFVREDRPERWGEVFENETTVQVYLIAENVTFRELIATVESGAVTGVTVLDEQHLAVNKTEALAIAGEDVSPAAQLIDTHLRLKDGRVVWMVSYMDGPVYTSIPVDAGEAPATGEKVPGFSSATAAGALLVPAAALHWRRR
jgi:hypothetical protein